MPERNSHCSWCGAAFARDQRWPRTCSACARTSYLNPIPVAVVLLPVDGGLLLVRRGIEPGKGKLALPGGYVDHGETWQEAGAREVREETGILVSPDELAPFDVLSAPDGTLLVFGLSKKKRAEASLPPFAPTNETTERVIVRKAETTAFSLHTQILTRYFAS